MVAIIKLVKKGLSAIVPRSLLGYVVLRVVINNQLLNKIKIVVRILSRKELKYDKNMMKNEVINVL